jgi:hypothetical protein
VPVWISSTERGPSPAFKQDLFLSPRLSLGSVSPTPTAVAKISANAVVRVSVTARSTRSETLLPVTQYSPGDASSS